MTLLKQSGGDLDKFEELVKDIEETGYDGIEDIIEIDREARMRN